MFIDLLRRSSADACVAQYDGSGLRPRYFIDEPLPTPLMSFRAYRPAMHASVRKWLTQGNCFNTFTHISAETAHKEGFYACKLKWTWPLKIHHLCKHLLVVSLSTSGVNYPKAVRLQEN